jgi:acetoin utilization protein AcuB
MLTMIVRDIMTTNLVTIAPDDTLAHAASLLRQHRFHHLPVVRIQAHSAQENNQPSLSQRVLLFEGLLTSLDIDLVAAVDKQAGAGPRPWQERLVVEVMHRAVFRVTQTTSVAAATQILVERALNSLPVVEYMQDQDQQEGKAVLVGLLTRSDILMALARAMGAFQPGTQLDISLSVGSMVALSRTLQLADELHVAIRSIIAAPETDGMPHTATLRLGTINPAPLLIRLQQEGIQYSIGTPLAEGEV